MFEKLQKDFLSAMFNEKKAREALFCKTEKSVYLLMNGSFFAKIPLEECFVKPSRYCRNIQPETLEKIENAETREKLIYTGITKQLNNEKNKVVIFTAENGEEIWLNEKFVKYFTDNKLITPVFYNTAGPVGKVPIKVYSGDLFIGAILPVYHN